MSEKTFNNVRIIHKHDTEENWLKAINFIPKQGELIIYDTDDIHTQSRFKIGDGETLVSDLPFSQAQQPNWDENDPESASYIQNRPFYSTGEYEKTEIMKATQFSLMFDDPDGRMVMVGGGLILIEGAEYLVTIGNQEYICKAQLVTNGYLALGNTQYAIDSEFGWPDEVEPFVIFGFDYPTLMYTAPGFQIQPITVYKISENIHYLDKKYVSNFLAGEKVANTEVLYDEKTYICGEGAEIFNSNSNRAIGANSHAEGERTVAIETASHAEGSGSKALGKSSHAEGSGTTASGNCSHAEGTGTIASGLTSHAEGYDTQAIKIGTHAEGRNTIANAAYLHVQGRYNVPEDIPKYSRVWMIWGSYPEYDGDKVIYIFNDEPTFNANEGTFTIVSMPYEATIKDLKKGDYFVSTYPESDIIDIYYYASELESTRVDESTGKTYYKWHYSGSDYVENSEPGTYLHIVGNGDYVYDEELKTHVEKRSNAHTLDWEGNAWFAGDVYVGSTSGTNRDEGSKKLATEDFVNEQINNTPSQIQSDWSQNDESELDYIKNRPFYSDGYEEIAIFTNQKSRGSIITNTYMYNMPESIKPDTQYRLVINDYEFIGYPVVDFNGTYCLGNAKNSFNEVLKDFSVSNLNWDEGEPFCLCDGTLTVKPPYESQYTLSLYKQEEKIKILDKKYIPYMPGEIVTGKTVIFQDKEYVCRENAEIFNDLNNIAIGSYSHAEGEETAAVGYTAHAEGYKTVVSGSMAHAEGSFTNASGPASHAEGSNTIANGAYSHAEGMYTQANGSMAHAEGEYTIANGKNSHVEGAFNIIDIPPKYNQVTSYPANPSKYDGDKIVYRLAEEPTDFDTETGTFKIGEYVEVQYKNLQTGDFILFSAPTSDRVDIYYSIAELMSTTDDGKYQWRYIGHTYSNNPTGSGSKYLHIAGNGTSEESRSNAHTLDWSGNAWYQGDVYVGSTSGVNRDEGSKKLATEEQIVGKKTEGTVVTFEDKEYTCGTGAEIFNDLSTNLAVGKDSHAEGSNTAAIGMNTHAEGSRSQAIGNFSHAENSSKALGAYAHSEGSQTVATGSFSHAEGWLSEAFAETSHAEGYGTYAAKRGSHVQGAYNEIDTYKGKPFYMPASLGLGANKTFNSNDIAYVLEGVELNSFTGEFTTDSIRETLVKDLQAEDMFALSNTNITQYYWLMSIESSDENQFTGYCVTMTGVPYDNLGKYVHIVGNGASAHSRSNAHTLDWDGNAWFAGDVYVGSTSGVNMDEGSKKLATEEDTQLKFAEAKEYADNAAKKIKDDLLNGAGDAYDTLKELGELIDENQDAIDALETVASSKADKTDLVGQKTEGKTYTINDSSVTAGTGAEIFNNYEYNIATGDYSYAGGTGTKATGYASHAEGSYSTASGYIAHAEGQSNATGTLSHSEGSGTAKGSYSHAEGQNTETDGYSSHAEGYNTKALNDYSHAEGQNTKATNTNAHAEGYDSEASGYVSHAEGQGTKAQGSNSHSEGYYTTASGSDSHAEGNNTVASGSQAHTEGSYTQATDGQAHAEGYGTKATRSQAHAEGNASEANGYYSHAEGNGSKAEASGSHAEGNYTIASGHASHAEGNHTTASGSDSHAEGYNTIASNSGAHAEGGETQASGPRSHAEGYNTKAIGENSHAEGYKTIAYGDYSHAEGYSSNAYGNYSYARGRGNIANTANLSVSGTYNLPEDKALFIEEVAADTRYIGTYTEYYVCTNTPVFDLQAGQFTGTTESRMGNADLTVGLIIADSASPFTGYVVLTNQKNSNNWEVERHSIVSTEGEKGKYLHIVGNGESDTARSNAHTLDWQGNAWYAGSMEATFIILSSPNGTRFSISVGDDGILTATEIVLEE